MGAEPRFSSSNIFLRNILDGELVWDNKNENSTWRKNHPDPLFLVFDALVINGTNNMPFNFTSRLVDADAYLKNRFTKARLLKRTDIVAPSNVPRVDIFSKEMFRI